MTPRLRELAREAAERRHNLAVDILPRVLGHCDKRGEPLRFDECLHPDCLLVQVEPPTPDLPADDEARCAVCGWTLVEQTERGCVRGNCSLRPFPRWFYAPERAAREYDQDLSHFDRRAVLRDAAASRAVPEQEKPEC